MCDRDGCDNESVCFVDLEPNGATVKRTTFRDNGGVPEPEEYDLPLGDQRLGFCISHAFEVGLNAIVTKGRIIKSQKNHPFPATHALSETHTWKVL